MRRTSLSLLSGVLAAAVLVPATPAAADTEVLSFAAVADASVSSASPTKSYGTAATLEVDAGPEKVGYLRFDVSGLSGRTVRSVRLRLHQVDKSPSGGRVHAMTSNQWTESVTWSTKPVIDGPQLGAFGKVVAGSTYDVSLGAAAVRGDGSISFAMDSTSTDGADWSTRESATPPLLLVEVAGAAGPVPAPEVDGVSAVAAPEVGSSDPTYYAGQHRLARTASGRLVTVHGRHASGVQLAWRDVGGAWQTGTAGSVTGGALSRGTGTGDWPASVAVATDRAGREHGWVVWSGTAGATETARALYARHLTELDSAAGPTVGPLLVLAEATQGGLGRADIALVPSPDGTLRAAVTWVQRTGTDTEELSVGWLADPLADVTTLVDATVLEPSDTSRKAGTFVHAPGGELRLVVRGAVSRLRIHRLPAGAGATAWQTGPLGPKITTRAKPAGVATSDGATVVAYESDTTNRTATVLRFDAAGALVGTDLVAPGLGDPTLASDGSKVWLLAVRATDGFVISRRSDAAGAPWSADQVEVGAEAGGEAAWPNPLREVTDGRLRFVVRGVRGSTENSAHAVLAAQRRL